METKEYFNGGHFGISCIATHQKFNMLIPTHPANASKFLTFLPNGMYHYYGECLVICLYIVYSTHYLYPYTL